MADTDPRTSVQRRQDYETAHRPAFDPREGELITLNLPDEVTRAKIVKVVSPTKIAAEIAQYTTGNKSHSYKKGDFVAAEFKMGAMNLRGWYVIPQSAMDAVQESRFVVPEPEPEPVVEQPKLKAKKGSK